MMIDINSYHVVFQCITTGCTAPPLDMSRPQARVGAVQRVCLDHQELHQDMHGHQARLVSMSVIFRSHCQGTDAGSFLLGAKQIGFKNT